MTDIIAALNDANAAVRALPARPDPRRWAGACSTAPTRWSGLPLMRKIFAVALGILTAIGGFLDIGDLVTNAVVGSRFGLALAWVVPSACSASACTRRWPAGSRRSAAARRSRSSANGSARGRPREPRRLVLHQPDDRHRRDRRHRAGVAAGHRRRAAAVDPGRRVRGLDRDLAGPVLDDGERHRSARAEPDRLRRRRVPAAPGLVSARAPGVVTGDPRAPSPRPPTGTTRSRCSARR